MKKIKGGSLINIMDYFKNNIDSNMVGTYSIVYIVLIGVLLLYFNYTNIAFSYQTFIYVIGLVLLLGFTLFYIYPNIRIMNVDFNNKLIYIATFVIIVTCVVSYLFKYISLESLRTVSYMFSILGILLFVFTMAIFYYVFMNYLKSRPGFTGFIVNLIFYIPCLLINFIEYILKECRLTTSIIFVLLFIEAVLILSYFFASKIMRKIFYKKNTQLLSDGLFLTSEHVIAYGSQVNKNNEKKIERKTNQDLLRVDTLQKPDFSQNFAISMWIYVNPQPLNFAAYDKETTIFSYGEGKPKITYFNDVNEEAHKDKYHVYFTDESEKKYEITLLGQKWNNIVFNYQSGIVDLFINGNLERSFSFTENNLSPPKYLDTDEIKVGSEDGIQGSICNINYYYQPLTKNEIVTYYNLLVVKNPPM
jgi:hypothetical protein